MGFGFGFGFGVAVCAADGRAALAVRGDGVSGRRWLRSAEYAEGAALTEFVEESVFGAAQADPAEPMARAIPAPTAKARPPVWITCASFVIANLPRLPPEQYSGEAYR